MVRFELALAFVLVGALIRSTLAVSARAKVRSLGLEYEPPAPPVLAPASGLETDTDQAAEAIDPDIDDGVHPRGQYDTIHR
jgi:hypothetical protein